MKKLLFAGTALLLIAGGLVQAGDITYQPINTDALVVKPSKAAASLASQAINMAGSATANGIKENGYVKTINNLFSSKTIIPHTQAGPSPLPAPTRFQSTTYHSYNTPVMPIAAPRK